MNIVVTGGGGFIGSHVADRFMQKGHQVSIIDNLLIGKCRMSIERPSSMKLTFVIQNWKIFYARMPDHHRAFGSTNKCPAINRSSHVRCQCEYHGHD